MIKLIPSICFVVLPMLIFAQFEGEIEMNTINSTNKEEASVTWSIKNDKHLMEVESISEDYKIDYGLLINEKEKKVWFLSANKNSEAIVIPYTQLEKGDFDIPMNSIVKTTNETKNIAGFNCNKYEIISNAFVMNCWISNDTGITHADFPSFMSTGDLLGLMKLNKIKGIPLEFEVKNSSGDLILAQYFTKISAKELSDSKFEEPSLQK